MHTSLVYLKAFLDHLLVKINFLLSISAIAKPKTPKPEIDLRPPSNTLNIPPPPRKEKNLHENNNIIYSPPNHEDNPLYGGEGDMYGQDIQSVDGLGPEMLDGNLGIPSGIGEPYPGVTRDYHNTYGVFDLFGGNGGVSGVCLCSYHSLRLLSLLVVVVMVNLH